MNKFIFGKTLLLFSNAIVLKAGLHSLIEEITTSTLRNLHLNYGKSSNKAEKKRDIQR